MKIRHHFREGSLGRNAGWMLAGQGLMFFTQGLYFVLLVRLLGSQQYGIFVGTFALVSIASQYSALGSGLVLLRRVSPNHKKFPEYWGNAILTTLSVGFVVILFLRGIANWTIGEGGASIIVLIALGECTCARLAECAGQAFQAFEKLAMTATLATLTSVARLIAVVSMTLVLHHATVRQWAIASVTVSAISATIAIVAVTKALGKPKFHPKLLIASAAEGLGFSFASSTTSIYNDLDKAMLSHYGMAVANGIYGMAYKVIDITCVPIRALHSAALPRFFKKGAAGVRGNIQLAAKLLAKTLPFALVSAVLMFVFAWIIPLVVGKSFAESVLALRLLCLLPIFRSLHLTAGDALTGGGYQRYRTACQIAAAGLNFGLNIFLIPAYSWRGAAWSSLMTDGFLAIANWVVLSAILKKEKSESLSSSEALEMRTVTYKANEGYALTD
jgi:O-antigen/teichoic acid export membrane protein